MDIVEARQRLVTAAARFTSAQHGGMDSENAEGEVANAALLLDTEVQNYYHAFLDPAKEQTPGQVEANVFDAEHPAPNS